MEQSAVEFIIEQLAKNGVLHSSDISKAKEIEKQQIGYTESDMRSYASYILNNPVIEPSQWYKIYRTKSE